jgi:hypothetical protein
MNPRWSTAIVTDRQHFVVADTKMHTAYHNTPNALLCTQRNFVSPSATQYAVVTSLPDKLFVVQGFVCHTFLYTINSGREEC